MASIIWCCQKCNGISVSRAGILVNTLISYRNDMDFRLVAAPRWTSRISLARTSAFADALYCMFLYIGCTIFRIVSELYYSILHWTIFVSKPSYSHGFCLGTILFTSHRYNTLSFNASNRSFFVLVVDNSTRTSIHLTLIYVKIINCAIKD